MNAEDRIKELEAQLAALQWQPITESNMPKVGDEVWGSFWNTSNPLSHDMARWPHYSLKEYGWTHFRPINPPAQEPK